MRERLASLTLCLAMTAMTPQAIASPVQIPALVDMPSSQPIHLAESDWRKIELSEERVSLRFPCAQEEVQRTSPDEALGSIYQCKVQGMTFGVILRKYGAGDPDVGYDALLASAQQRQTRETISLLEEFEVAGKRAFRLVCKIGVCHQDADSVSMEAIDLAPGVLLIVGADESRLPEGDQPLGRQYAAKFYSSLEIAQ